MTPTIDMTRLPRHIAIIMDGNGRWAARHGLTREDGHDAGAKSVKATVEACRELGIQALTVYAFSTENWRRSEEEIGALFRLLSKYIRLEVPNIHKEDIRVTFMGRLDDLSPATREDLDYSMELTRNNKSMLLNVALNYGSRAEIVDAARRAGTEIAAGTIRAEDLTEDRFARYLYVPDLPELDLLIRTSGEFRLSNFMLWQLSYAEIVVLNTLWPDFRKRHLLKAIAEFQSRHRRFGGR